LSGADVIFVASLVPFAAPLLRLPRLRRSTS